MTPPTGSAKLPPPSAPKSASTAGLPQPKIATGVALKVAPLDAMGPAVSTGAKPNPTAASKAIAPSATSEEGFNPTKLMRHVDEGDIMMKLPLNAGDYGTGKEAFTVPAGVTLRIHAVVRDGRLVPGITRIDFIDRQGKNVTLDNMLWVETHRFELTPDGKVVARLSGFPDQEITKSMLSIDCLPLDMPGLYDTITTRAKEMEQSAAKFTSGGPLFDPDAYGLELTNCVIAPGVFPLPDPTVKLDIGGVRPPPQLLAQRIHDASERGDYEALKPLLEEAIARAKNGEIRPAEVHTLIKETLPEVIKKADAANDYKWWEILLLVLAFFTIVGGISILLVDHFVEFDHEASHRLSQELLAAAEKMPHAPQDHSGRTVLTMIASGKRMHIEGQFELNSVGVDRKELQLKGKKTSAYGTLDVDFEAGKPAGMVIRLEDIKVETESLHLEDGQGSVVNLGPSKVRGGEVKLGFDVKKGVPTGAPLIECGRVVAQVQDSTLMIPGIAGEPTALRIAEGEIDGRVAIDEHGKLVINAKAVKLKAAASGLETGDGAFKIGYTSADIEGSGRLVYEDGEARFSGDVSLRGTVDDGRVGVPGGMFHADIATGAKVELKLTELGFGKKGVDLSASGHLEVGLDSGEIMLANGSRFRVTRGAKAVIEVKEAKLVGGKTTFKGSVEIEGQVGADFDAKKLSGAGVTFRSVAGVTGKIKVKLDDVDLQADGSLSIKGLKTNASFTATTIKGKLDISKMPSIPKPTGKEAGQPQLAITKPPTMKVIGASKQVSAPTELDLISKVDGANISIRVPLPGYKSTLVDVQPMTFMDLTATVKGGVIDYSSFKVSFTPEIDLPGPLGGKGFYLEKDGSLIADIDWAPDVNLSKYALNGIKIPVKLTELFGAVSTIASVGSSLSVGKVASPGLDDLSRLGITATLSDVTLDGSKLSLGAGGDVTVDADSKLKITFGTIVSPKGEHGILRVQADVKLNDANFSSPEMVASALKGKATIDLRVVGDGADRVTVAKVDGDFAAQTLAVARPDALIQMSQPSLKGGLTLIQIGASDPTIDATFPSVSGILGDSQVNVTRAGKTAAVVLNGGTAFTGAVSVDSKSKRVGAQLTVANLDVTTGAVDLGLRGLDVKVDKIKATATGTIKIGVDGTAGTTAISIDGDVRASLEVPEGGFGDSKSSFAFRFGKATSAAVVLDHLQLGDTPATTSVMVSGSTRKGATRKDDVPAAHLKVTMKSGQLVLPDGFKLTITDGAEGDIRIESFKRSASDTFASVKGQLILLVNTSTSVPKQGLQIAAGVRLMNIEGSKGKVALVVDDFQLDGDGKFTLTGTHVSADVSAKQLDAKLDVPKLLTTVSP